MYKTRFFYSSSSVPSQIKALLARKSHNCMTVAQKHVSSCVFTSNMSSGQYKLSQRSKTHIGVQATVAGNDLSQPIVHFSEVLCVDVLPNAVQYSHSPVQGHTIGRFFTFESTGHGFESYNNGVPQSPDIVIPNDCSLDHSVDSSMSTPPLSLVETEVVGNRDAIIDVKNKTILSPHIVGHGFESHSTTGNFVASGPASVTEVQQPDATPPHMAMVHCVKGFDSCVDKSSSEVPSVNLAFKKYDQLRPIYDVNNMAMEEKFISTIIFANQGDKGLPMGSNNPVYSKWQHQVDFPFGFVPLGDQTMPEDRDWCQAHS